MILDRIADASTKIKVRCEHHNLVDRRPADGVGRLLGAVAIMVLAVWPALILLALGAVPGGCWYHHTINPGDL